MWMLVIELCVITMGDADCHRYVEYRQTKAECAEIAESLTAHLMENAKAPGIGKTAVWSCAKGTDA